MLLKIRKKLNSKYDNDRAIAKRSTEMKQPNRTRKYKPIFYIILLVGILMCLSFPLSGIYEKIISTKMSNIKEGIDYFSDSLIVTDKQKKSDISGYVYMFSSGYWTGTFDTTYYLYSNDKKIETSQNVYNSVDIGDIVITYKTSSGEYNTSLEYVKHSIADKSGIMLLFILTPGLGLLILIELFFNRKLLYNPYYKY